MADGGGGVRDWGGYDAALRTRGKALSALHPDLVRAFVDLGGAASKARHLDARTRELIAVAVAVTTRCDGCIAAHVAKAKAAGATREELAEAVAVAVALAAGAAFTYGLHVLDAAEAAGVPTSVGAGTAG